MTRLLFFTGYPGFLGSELLPRLLRRDPSATALCLVQPKFAVLARERATSRRSRPLRRGDITSPIAAPADDVTEIYHFAAIYHPGRPARARHARQRRRHAPRARL